MDAVPGWRVDFRPRKHVGERIEVVADRNPALRTCLQRHGAPPAERIEHDVARPRVPLDEVVRDLRREHAVIRAHGVHRVTPARAHAVPERPGTRGTAVDRVPFRGVEKGIFEPVEPLSLQVLLKRLCRGAQDGSGDCFETLLRCLKASLKSIAGLGADGACFQSRC